MKRIISGFIALTLTLTAALSSAVWAFAASSVKLGDVNSDSKIDSADATLVLQRYASLIDSNALNFNEQAADMNSDSKIDSVDATLILQVYAGISVNEEEPGEIDPLALQVVELVNEQRINEGLEALTVNDELCRNAQVRAEEAAVLASHTRPDGTLCFTAITVPYMTAGENLAFGYKTPADAMNAWMNSEGHRANILNGDFTQIGVGVYQENGVYYWSQFFIG